ncbi:MAG TPA: LysR family transcriptional regulator [Amaricoccus sp.]|uniref:LysR family transcriptional regulator n=1 Tax=Amaricoccus sp. TaxID=1872485 RepID=UPI002B78A63F|nr:LysR family transcriptional regulator [Amaricoccus sp.]HMQ91678.1 LysR family transcriptional regulator [Amaricoccus sp.]HMR52219.1 LysR family transcriptional regulator [Amaricoccus sp.]HMT99071.1 LysR family transcriptional regulator [Amaricoccus sp.]
MDTEIVRTFLEIVSTGSFIRTAERLNVAQTTVSARIRTLEERLGRSMFVRHKGGASLTPAGEQFLRYAPTFVQLWQRMRHQVAVPPGHSSLLIIGGEVSLWQPLVLDWMSWMRRSRPDIALRIHIDVPQDLINQVAAGLVDAAVMYAPPHRHGVRVDLLLDEKLVLVTTDPEAGRVDSPGFVSVDWGPEFAREFGSSFPDATGPGLSVNLGPLALRYILAAGGSGYFRMHAVKPYLASGRLHLVPGMPQFSYPIYAVSSVDADDSLLGPALAGLREVTSAGTPA